MVVLYYKSNFVFLLEIIDARKDLNTTCLGLARVLGPKCVLWNILYATKLLKLLKDYDKFTRYDFP